jgi:hypothetical protein
MTQVTAWPNNTRNFEAIYMGMCGATLQPTRFRRRIKPACRCGMYIYTRPSTCVTLRPQASSLAADDLRRSLLLLQHFVYVQSSALVRRLWSSFFGLR